MILINYLKSIVLPQITYTIMKYVLVVMMFISAIIGSFGLVNCSSNKPTNGSESNNTVEPMIKNTNPYYSRTDTTKLNVTDSDWKSILPEEVYLVGRMQHTEESFTGKYWNFEGIGNYYCAICGNKLFLSDSKFASSCGWPSFFEAVSKKSVIFREDRSFGMNRTEVLCGRCNSHLGHIFDDGPPPTGMRYCMNSVVLDFEPKIK